MKAIYIVWSWFVFISWKYLRRRRVIGVCVLRALGVLSAVLFSDESFAIIKDLIQQKVAKASKCEMERMLEMLRKDIADFEQMKREAVNFPELHQEIERTLEVAKSILAAREAGESNMFAESAFIREYERRLQQKE